MLAALEALERRGVLYHKAVPALVEVAEEQWLEDGVEQVQGRECWSRRIRVAWAEFHREAPLFQEGLEGFRARLGDLPSAGRGVRVRLGYAFPGGEAQPAVLTCLQSDGQRWEIQLAFPAEVVLGEPPARRKNAHCLLVADLAEALYDVLGAPYGALRFDAGVLPDQLPRFGWSFLAAALVEVAGRAQVEAFSRRCFKSWELADGGWFLAPAPLLERDEALEQERERLLAPARHLTLETMGGHGWKMH